MQETTDTTAAVIGLGAMGGRAAAALARAGHHVRGYDPVEAARARAADAGVSVPEDAADCVRPAQVVVLSLPMPEDVTAFAAEHGPRLGSGTTVIDLSTIDPVTARAAADTLAAHDVTYLDAPVLGRPESCGSWLLPVGGPEDRVRQAEELLVGPVARAVVRAGDVGAGSTIKLLNNLMFGAINAMTAELLTTCTAAGVDPKRFVEIVIDSNSAAVSNLFRELAPKVVAEDYTPTFALRLLHKDNRLAVKLAEDLGCPTLMGSMIHQINALGLAAGHGNEDTGAVIKTYARLSAHQADAGGDHA